MTNTRIPTTLLRQIAAANLHTASTGPSGNAGERKTAAPENPAGPVRAGSEMSSQLQAAGQKALSTPAIFTAQWIADLPEAQCRALGAVQRQALLEQVNTDQPEVLGRLLCLPLSEPAVSARIQALGTRVAEVLRPLVAGLPGVLRGDDLKQAAAALLPLIQQALGIPAHLMLGHVGWEPLRTPGSVAHFERRDGGEQPGMPPVETLRLNSARLETGFTPAGVAEALGHEMFHKLQYLHKDAISALERTGLSLPRLQQMSPNERLQSVYRAWPAEEDGSLRNVALQLLADPSVLAVARLNTACIDLGDELRAVPGSGTHSVLEQQAYAFGAQVRKALQS